MVKKIFLLFYLIFLFINCLSQEDINLLESYDSCNCAKIFEFSDSSIIGITPEVLPIMVSKSDRYEEKVSQFFVDKKVHCDIYIELIINKKGYVACGRIIKGNNKYKKELLGILKNIKYFPGKNKDQFVNAVTYLLLKYDEKNNLYLINY